MRTLRCGSLLIGRQLSTKCEVLRALCSRKLPEASHETPALFIISKSSPRKFLSIHEDRCRVLIPKFTWLCATQKAVYEHMTLSTAGTLLKS
ncbi:Sorbicillinoid biosynthetic cluster transcription factor 2 [Fusarium oxysporum f. sp. albedinis]|nr:Sorbicillinoid biosynthetic cluster transcription factor 2 [Fusarium oxysporum f. sp. albedinis]